MKQFKRKNAEKYIKRDLRELSKLGISADIVMDGRSIESWAWNSKSYDSWRRAVRKAKKGGGFYINQQGVPISLKEVNQMKKMVEDRNKKTSSLIEEYKKDHVVTKTDIHYLQGKQVVNSSHSKTIQKQGLTLDEKPFEDLIDLITKKEDIKKEMNKYKRETNKINVDKLIEVDGAIEDIIKSLENEGLGKRNKEVLEINISDMSIVEKQILIDVWDEYQQNVESALETDSRYIGEIYLAFDKIVTDRVHNRSSKTKAI